MVVLLCMEKVIKDEKGNAKETCCKRLATDRLTPSDKDLTDPEKSSIIKSLRLMSVFVKVGEKYILSGYDCSRDKIHKDSLKHHLICSIIIA